MLYKKTLHIHFEIILDMFREVRERSPTEQWQWLGRNFLLFSRRTFAGARPAEYSYTAQVDCMIFT